MSTDPTGPEPESEVEVDWQRRVVGRSLRTATEKSVDRGARLIRAAGIVLERAEGGDITVQDVADEAGQSLRTLYQYFESKDDLLLALFEESMRAYARLIENAIEGIDDPGERLAAAMLAAQRIPDLSQSGVNIGLARLRLRLADTRPELVGRAQAAMVSVVRRLVEAASDAGAVAVDDVEAATFLLLSTNAAVITADRVGNDAGVAGPDAMTAVAFCLRGLGAEFTAEDLAAIDRRLTLPKPPKGSKSSKGSSRRPRSSGGSSA